jgi:hypothetical protein
VGIKQAIQHISYFSTGIKLIAKEKNEKPLIIALECWRTISLGFSSEQESLK